MSFQINWSDNNAYVEFFNELTFKDFQEVNGLIYGDSRFDSMQFQIADFTNVNTINVTSEEIRIISTLELKASVWNKFVKVAHVTSVDQLKELVHVYEDKMKDSNWEFGLFDTFEEAKKWCI